MSHAHVQYLLVGGGIAASSAAETIRRFDPAGSAMLIGQEITRPYHRPPLSKQFLRDGSARESLFTQDVGWFAQHDVQLQTGHRVSAIDVARRWVVLDSGKEVGFERLLLATGSSPLPLTIPGATLPNVYYLRTLEDTDRLRASIEQAKREGRPHPPGHGLPRNITTGRGRATVIGGGLLGAELAASLTQMGLVVDWVVTSSSPWNHIAGDAAGRFIASFLEHHGVTVHCATTALRLEGDGRVQRAALSTGGSIEADLVIAAVGSAMNRQILRGTPIRAEKAVLTDAGCRTNVEGVFAAGDCAAVFDPALGKHRIGHHWTDATLTGQIAGENMAGGNATYAAVAQFDSMLFGLTIRVFGDMRLVDRRIVRGTPNIDSSNFMEIGLDSASRIVQIIAFGSSHDTAKLESLVRERHKITGQGESMKDPQSPF